MSEKRSVYKIQDIGGIGEVHISDEVITKIAALAATEADGVSSMAGNIKHEQISRMSMKALAKGIRVNIGENTVSVEVNLNIDYDRNIVGISQAVQDKVKTTIENMTGLTVPEVNVRIAGVGM